MQSTEPREAIASMTEARLMNRCYANCCSAAFQELSHFSVRHAEVLRLGKAELAEGSRGGVSRALASQCRTELPR